MAEVTLIFIRHGEKDRSSDSRKPLFFKGAKKKKAWSQQVDPKRPLTPEARKDVEALAGTLRELQVTPDVVLRGSFLHARETGEGLWENTVACKTLDPVGNIPLSLLGLIGAVPSDARTVAVVGHEPRLSQLVAAATGKRIRPLEHLGVISVEAESWVDLRRGLGEVAWRYPVRTYELKSLEHKLGSKMTVATLLAGFTFTALLQVVTSASFRTAFAALREPEWTWAYVEAAMVPLAASVSLIWALTLFVVAVYVYDALSMPAGFWNVWKSGSADGRPKWRKELIERDGLVYLHMIHAWTHVFTPAVRSAAIGFLLVAWWNGSWVLAALFGVVGCVAVYACHEVHPRLGVD